MGFVKGEKGFYILILGGPQLMNGPNVDNIFLWVCYTNLIIIIFVGFSEQFKDQ